MATTTIERNEVQDVTATPLTPRSHRRLFTIVALLAIVVGPGSITHQLDSTEGLYYSQMEREAPVLDENGEPVIGEDGEPVMGPNQARMSWINATTLTTVLGMGIMAYALSAFAIAAGAVMLALGLAVYRLRAAQITVA